MNSDCFEDDASHAEKLQVYGKCQIMIIHLWLVNSAFSLSKINLEGIICSNILAVQYLFYTSLCSRASIRFRTTQVFQFKVFKCLADLDLDVFLLYKYSQESITA